MLLLPLVLILVAPITGIPNIVSLSLFFSSFFFVARIEVIIFQRKLLSWARPWFLAVLQCNENTGGCGCSKGASTNNYGLQTKPAAVVEDSIRQFSGGNVKPNRFFTLCPSSFLSLIQMNFYFKLFSSFFPAIFHF